MGSEMCIRDRFHLDLYQTSDALHFGEPAGFVTMKIMHFKLTGHRAPWIPKWGAQSLLVRRRIQMKNPWVPKPKQRHGKEIGFIGVVSVSLSDAGAGETAIKG